MELELRSNNSALRQSIRLRSGRRRWRSTAAGRQHKRHRFVRHSSGPLPDRWHDRARSPAGARATDQYRPHRHCRYQRHAADENLQIAGNVTMLSFVKPSAVKG